MSDLSIQDGLKSLIEKTYIIEAEYERLNASYASLRQMIGGVIDAIPDALWVLNSNKSLFLSNSKASNKDELLRAVIAGLGEESNSTEVEFNGGVYLAKLVKSGDKIIITATDITVQKRTERLVSMGQVAAHLAHEIRNPIGSLSLLASSLPRYVSGKGEILAQQMQKAIWRVERIIKATLLFTKGVKTTPKQFKFSSLAKECTEAIEYYEYSKQIEFNLDFGDMSYVGDADLIAMVFDNLIFNAIDAIEESDDDEGEVRLWHEKEGDELKFYIYDSGVSIADTGAIFEPFKTSKLKGNGLGLALCVQIIAAHGGSIEIALNPKTFCVSLPLAR
ncbi:PAS domain-containing sensor histidine kinase [Campylobacter sp. 19-13652]|uniref:sensor histidine kinase n=1 Tax=Campylobacter sp. 19-13652 TaxID=2840180 RepID=UPI001C798722|nr:HAMP domain-containing sensor histidine kinase [Campylobacter sp. 19-13652]BCX78866.1 two-component sensor histidine kinase [Campylobacter sp. 19-13652]